MQNETPAGDAQRIGITVTELTPLIRQNLKVPDAVNGIVVAEVLEGSAAELAGMKAGDVIQEVNRKPIATTGDFKSALSARQSTVLLLRVSREGHNQFLAVR